jgi:hypothetical protein
VSTFLTLGKHGDVVSILPILHHEFETTGNKPTLVVSEPYSAIPKELDYINTVIYPGAWNDLPGAIAFCKQRFSQFCTPQMYGTTFQPRRSTPSFQLDQWARCGALDLWGKLPLVVPKKRLLSGVNWALYGVGEKPYILFADESQSAPFPHANDLASALAETFPSHQIVRLSTIRVPSLLNLIPLYDSAELIISVDTLHLHLSAATDAPLIALIRDTPGRWHGSAYHPRMALHIRYGSYHLRKAELLHVAKQLVNNAERPYILRVPTARKHGYNLSMMKVGDKVWKTYRWHPDHTWRTELRLIRDGQEFDIKGPKKYEGFSFEDARLFQHLMQVYLSCTVARSKVAGENGDKSITAIARLHPDGTLTDWIEPQIGKNNWSGMEKNWVVFEHDGKLHVSYKCYPQHEVYELNSQGRITKTYKTKSPTCDFGEPRGGSQPLPYGDHWLRFFHTNQLNKKSDVWWQYHVGAMVMESKPPFRILQVSKHPILSGDELYTPHCRHWKPSVRIVYGAIKTDTGWQLALGANDCACEIADVTENQLNL